MMSRSSTTNIPLILRLVNETTSIVNVAGSIVRKVMLSGSLDIVDKGTNDLQTKADRAAQQYIVQKLTSNFPKASIIGEEGNDINECLGDLVSPVSPNSASIPTDPFPEILTKTVPDHISNISEDQVVIWVDPLDGTKEFTQGLVTHVTVLVGIAVNGTPIGGVIHQPFYKTGENIQGRTMWGIPDVGFGGFKVVPPPLGKRIITTTRSHATASVESALAALKPDDVLRVGGAGHKAILLMEGQAHAYVFDSAGCKKWDTCAPEAILRAIGAKLTDMNGEPYKYDKDVQHKNDKGLLATAPGEDHEWYLQCIRQSKN